MRKKHPFIVVCIICLISQVIYSQSVQLSNIRNKTFLISSDSLQIDSLSIVPGTLELSSAGLSIDSSSYSFNFSTAQLVWKHKPIGDTVWVRYRVFSFNISASLAHKDFNEKKKSDIGIILNPFEYRPEADKFSNISFGGLAYSGSLTRGISFGNNQDLVLNSALNLQMSGNVNPDIEVLASLTDNNIPIQPEGNTQQLQQFEKIFIQLKLYQHHVITLGDIENSPSNSYFMKYYRNAQGIKYNGNLDFEKHGNLQVDLLGGIARGKFAKNTLAVSEGNQGPYKLRGNNGETYLIVLAGSERVYINGVLMKRGYDQDYVIDYNLGEIVFTAQRLITKDLRVSVEFNYSERNYLRSTLGLNVQYTYKKLQAGVQIFSEQDAKDQNTQQKITTIQKQTLSSIGDSLQNAYAAGFKYEAFTKDRILYSMKDTILPDATHYDSVFVYETDSTKLVYYLSFTQVGAGKGNYILASSGSNGRVYVWIAPIANKPQGDYEPIQVLIAPSKQTMYAINLSYAFNDKNKWKNEIAFSDNDPNTYSVKDNASHKGFAVHTAYDNTISVHKQDSTGLNAFQNSIAYEYINKHFNFIERYRDIQFSRNWNIEKEIGERTSEHLGSFSTKYISKRGSFVSYALKNYIIEGRYQGYEHGLLVNYYTHRLFLRSSSTLLHAHSTLFKSILAKPQVEIAYDIKALKGYRIGFVIDDELNKSQDLLGDTLSSLSHIWQQYKFYIQAPDSLSNKLGFSYIFRSEQFAGTKSFLTAHFKAHTFSINGDIQSSQKHQLSYIVTYRHVDETDSSLAHNLLQNYYLGKIEYRVNEWKGFLRSNVYYELGAGREPKIEFTYIESPNGSGQYAYKDLNGNGVRELNEYYISQFNDQNRYIKMFNTTTALVAVNSAQLNFSLQLSPYLILNREKRLGKFFGRFSSNTVVQVNKKVFSKAGLPVYEYFNPLPYGTIDSQLVSTNSFLRQSFYFNRSNAKYGLEYNFTFNTNKAILTNGFDTRKSLVHNLTARWNIYKGFSTTVKYENGYKSNYSDFFVDRRYKIVSNELQADLSYLIKQKLRFTLSYQYSFFSNTANLNDGQYAVINGLNFETKYSSLKQGTASAKISFINVGYNDGENKNTQVEFVMLQGLQSGLNVIWNLSYARKISENVELTISYDGRKTGSNAKIIHTGGAQIRAYF